MFPSPEPTVYTGNSVGVRCRRLGTGCLFPCNARRTVPWGSPFGPVCTQPRALDIGVLCPGTGPAPGLPVSEVLPLLQVPESSDPRLVRYNLPVNSGTPYRVEL